MEGSAMEGNAMKAVLCARFNRFFQIFTFFAFRSNIPIGTAAALSLGFHRNLHRDATLVAAVVARQQHQWSLRLRSGYGCPETDPGFSGKDLTSP